MRTPLLLLSMFLGVILTVHLAMNGAVGAALNNPRVGNALFWCIGAVTALAIGATGWQAGALSGLSSVNPIMLTAGAMGATLVFGIAWLHPTGRRRPVHARAAGRPDRQRHAPVALRVAGVATAAHDRREPGRRRGHGRRHRARHASIGRQMQADYAAFGLADRVAIVTGPVPGDRPGNRPWLARREPMSCWHRVPTTIARLSPA